MAAFDPAAGLDIEEDRLVGAGPAGLLLSQFLYLNGIEAVVVERHDRAYVEARIRAGVLEEGTDAMLNQTGVGERCAAEGLVHEGTEIALNGTRHHIDFRKLTGGRVLNLAASDIHDHSEALIAFYRRGDCMFENKVGRAELDYVLSSTAAKISLAENYVGLPFEGPLP